MARTFDGTNDRIDYSGAATGGSGGVRSGFCWLTHTGGAAEYVVFESPSTSINSSTVSMLLWMETASTFQILQYRDTDGSAAARDFGAAPSSTVGAFGWSWSGSMGTAPDAYVGGSLSNGTGDTTTGTAESPGGVVVVGGRANDNNRNWTGLIAHLALWDEELTSAEHAALGAGVSPLLIRPEALLFYALDGGYKDRLTGAGTLSSAPASAESPLVSIGGVWPANYTPAAAVTGAFKPPSGMALMGVGV